MHFVKPLHKWLFGWLAKPPKLVYFTGFGSLAGYNIPSTKLSNGILLINVCNTGNEIVNNLMTLRLIAGT